MYAKSFDSQHIETFRSWCSSARNIVLLSHVNADGDACGSILACALILQHTDPTPHTVTPILPNGCPYTFDWLPSSSLILSGDEQRAQCEASISNADLIVCLDFNSPGRIDFLQDALVASSAHKVLIDHHQSPDENHFDIIFSDPDISSTCELLLWLSQSVWGDRCLNSDVARCLYTGLRTDTGGFAFSCHQPSCFEAAALLVSYDIRPSDIHNRIVNTFSINRMMFYGFALTQRLSIFPQQKVALFAFSLADQQQFNVEGEDMEGLVNYTLMMNDIEVGALLREEPNRTKVSLRAKYDVDVSILAQQIGGGGHMKAAGATYGASLSETLPIVKEILGISNQEPLNTALGK